MMISRQCSDSVLQRRVRPKRPTLALVLFLTLAPAMTLMAQSLADTVVRDAALCGSLTTAARDALNLGYVQAARELLDEALSFVPSDPDSNYLRALLGLSNGENLADASTRLKTALSGGEFRLYETADARLLYSSVLLRTGRPAEALRLLQGLSVSAESLYIESVAAFKLGDAAGSRAAVLSSLKRYPVDPRPLLSWLHAGKRSIREAEDALVVEAGFLALQKLKEIDPGILIALAPYADSSEAARLLVREYRAMGHSSAAATVLALSLGLISEARATMEMVSGSYLLNLEAVHALYSQLASDESRQGFVDAFKGFSGLIIADADRDGNPEESVWYEAGVPQRWLLDDNQDGIPEMEATFLSGIPVGLSAGLGSVRLSLKYDSWPYLREAGFSDADGLRRYSLGPAVLSYPAIAIHSLPGLKGPPYFISRHDASLPTETAVSRLAFAVHTSGKGSSSIELHDGIPERAWWTDEFERIGKTVYSAGVPSDERIDADGDGIFEARRVWHRNEFGKPEASYLELDIDGDGIYEYRESLSATRLRSWDYDGDGLVDMSLETNTDGSLVYRHSGIQGLTEAVYLGGSLVRMTVAGLPMPLLKDSGGLVVWIGKKPFDFGATRPEMGRSSKNGVMYTVFAIEGTIYAQLLE
ncbi:MAG: hypothetical protein RBT62_03310 [Spirochaetia bacterium]|nr:hypothetical protein [Spirochaetia bacterium]